jgi:hypothetical protein
MKKRSCHGSFKRCNAGVHPRDTILTEGPLSGDPRCNTHSMDNIMGSIERPAIDRQLMIEGSRSASGMAVLYSKTSNVYYEVDLVYPYKLRHY